MRFHFRLLGNDSYRYTPLLRVTFPLPSVGRSLDFLQQHSMVPGNASGLPRNNDVIARAQAIPRHALLGKLRRRSSFNHPQRRIAFVIRRLYLHKRMRIAPYEFFQGSFNPYALAMDVGRRSGMMPEGSTGA